MTSEEKEALLVKVQSFGENFKDEEFHDIYTLKDHLSSVLESKSNQSRQAQLTDMLETEGDRLKILKTELSYTRQMVMSRLRSATSRKI